VSSSVTGVPGGGSVKRLVWVIAQPVAVCLTVAADLLGRLSQRLAHGLEAVALIKPAGHDQAEAGAYSPGFAFRSSRISLAT